MILRYFIVFVLIFLIFGRVWGSALGSDSGSLYYYEEANGLRVLLSVNKRLPVVEHGLWYSVGSLDDPPGYSGLSHILEHMMFKGTALHADGFSDVVNALGGIENAHSSRYYTRYYQVIASEHWPLMAAFEADRMRNLRFSADELSTELDVVYEERLSRVENRPFALLSERVASILHGGYPYGRPIIGWRDELLAHRDRGDIILDFYARHYHPGNAILVVSGDIEIESAKATIAETYGKIPPADDIKSAAVAVVPPLPNSGVLAREVHYSDVRVSRAILGLSLSAPSLGYHSGADSRISYRGEDIFPLMIIADVLNSPEFDLQRDLVRTRELALGISVYYTPLDRGPAAFEIYAVPRQGVSMEDLRDILVGKLAAISSRGLTSEEIAASKLRLRDSVLLSYDSLGGYSNLAAQAMSAGLSFADFLTWEARFSAVSDRQVNEALRRYLSRSEGLSSGVWSFLRAPLAETESEESL